MSSIVISKIITHLLVLMRGTITPIQHWFNTLQLLSLVVIEIYVSVGFLLAVTCFEIRDNRLTKFEKLLKGS